MQNAIATQILQSRDDRALADTSWAVGGRGPGIATGAREQERQADLSRELAGDLRSGLSALGAKLGQEGSGAKAKERLLSLMEEAATLCGLGADGAILRSVDFNGSAPEGRLSAAGLRDIVAPERPHKEGSMFKLVATPDGGLRPSASAKRVLDGGMLAFEPRRVAALAVERVDRALGGLEPIWEAARACAENEARLGSELGGSSAWSRDEMRQALETSMAKHLVPLAPGSGSFPGPVEGYDAKSKLDARRSRSAEPAAPKRGAEPVV